MPITFYDAEDMKRAIEIGEKCKVFERYHYTANMETTKILFHADKQEEQKKFVCAINIYNTYSGTDPICYHIV